MLAWFAYSSIDIEIEYGRLHTLGGQSFNCILLK